MVHHHTINLTNFVELYEIKSTCFNNDEFPFIPIQIFIKNEVIRQRYGGCKYLLQIWNTSTKMKVYEQPLKSKLLHLSKLF